jgi:2-C-methyl-D-erythritol 2,4-cyclodiphosphate synthase
VRVGIGYDIHRFVRGRPLFLGGVRIPHPKGLLGHSDGDALLHAVTDALLGALGLGDIGEYFPDTDPKHRGASSALFLGRAVREARRRGWRVSNVDAVVTAEEPKIAPHREAIRRSLAKLLGAPPADVNVKAKTMEGLGPVGRKLALEAACVLVLRKGR